MNESVLHNRNHREIQFLIVTDPNIWICNGILGEMGIELLKRSLMCITMCIEVSI